MSFKSNITLTMRQLNDKNFHIIETAPDKDDVILFRLTDTDRQSALNLLTTIAYREHGDEYSGYGYGAIDPGKNMNPIPLPLQRAN